MGREKVVAQCEWAIKQSSPTIIEAKKFYEEVLALLKEPEAVEPHHKCIGETYSLIRESHVMYCPWCGRKIKKVADQKATIVR